MWQVLRHKLFCPRHRRRSASSFRVWTVAIHWMLVLKIVIKQAMSLRGMRFT